MNGIPGNQMSLSAQNVNQLIGTNPKNKKIELANEQKNFIGWFLNQPGRVCVLTGHAGTGKTTVMGDVDSCIDAVWCAPTHKAKGVLAKHIKRGTVSTIDSALGMRPRFNPELGRIEFIPMGYSVLDEKRFVVFDEASMIDEQKLNWILEKRIEKILFVGDHAQLPPVNFIYSPIFQQGYPTYSLKEVHRQQKDSPILDFSIDVRETGGKNPDKFGIKTVGVSLENVMEFFRRYPEGVAVCPTHKEKEFANMAARKVFDIHETGKPFLPGERLMLESPIDPPKGPQNGDFVTIAKKMPESNMYLGFHVWDMNVIDVFGDEYSIKIPNDENEKKAIDSRVKFLSKEFRQSNDGYRKKELSREMEILTGTIVQAGHGYAVTIHKSQGSTYQDVLFLTGGMKYFTKKDEKKRMAYTAITRASKNLILCDGDLNG